MENTKLMKKSKDNQFTEISLKNLKLNRNNFIIIAGPCSIESEEQLTQTAKFLLKMGIKIMRASAFKPRSSPYSFQGLGFEGLKLLKKVSKKTGILIESEVMDVRDMKKSEKYLDLIRIGSRNMQNFDLLKEAGRLKKPVILKRGMAATIKEFMMAAEYILAHGNKNVILCERGIRTFETAYRNTLDLNAVSILKKETHLPVIVDPSHAAGDHEHVTPLALAAAAVGADGLLVEIHPQPKDALSDGEQSLTFEEFKSLLKQIKPICKLKNRIIV